MSRVPRGKARHYMHAKRVNVIHAVRDASISPVRLLDRREDIHPLREAERVPGLAVSIGTLGQAPASSAGVISVHPRNDRKTRGYIHPFNHFHFLITS